MQISKSTVVNAPIDTVWQVLRDFNSHSQWHPAIADSSIDAQRPADAVSAVRRFHLQDGSELSEQLLSLSDREYSLRYCLNESPVPLENYVAEVSLKPVTDSNYTFWQWRSRFDAPPGREQELKSLVEEQIYQAGFDAIKNALGGQGHVAESSDNTTDVMSKNELPDQPVRYYSFAATQENPASPATTPAATVETGNVADGAVIPAPAIIVNQYGGPEVMQYQSVDVPPPGHNEVRIRHRAIGVNYIDVYCRTGYFGFLQPPGGLGMEAAGEIIDVGPDVQGFKPGDRIAYAAPPVGAYSAVRNIGQDALVRLPARMTFKTAAAIMLKGMTAEFLLHQVYALKQGDTILVHAAAGGVGSLLCQWAKTKGATVLGTVSTEDKAEFARANGCHFPIFYTREDFVERVMAITQGKGVDAVFDAIGRQTFGKSIECIRDGGHVISFGQAGEPLGEWDIGSFAAKSLTLSRPNFGHYTDTPEKSSAICKNLFHALENGIVKVHIGQQFSLADAVAAHQALEARTTTGSTILIPD